MKKRIIFGRRHNKIDPKDTIVKLNTIDHNEKLYQKLDLELESYDEVHIFFFLDKSKYIRHIIKDADSLLKTEGKFVVHTTNNRIHGSYLRSISQIKSEISLCLNDRYHLLNEENTKRVHSLKYKKFTSVIQNGDTINKWSFGVITNGKDFDLLDKLVSSIEKQKIPEYEIIVCGPNYSSTNKNLINIGDISPKDIRAPICSKKNKIIDSTRFENVAIFHARYELPDLWFDKIKAFGNLFEILILPSITRLERVRINDWSIFQQKFMAIYLPKYNHYCEDWYAQGGVIISKRRILKEVPLNENLHWDEFEDVVFSNELKIKGYTVHLDTKNYLITSSNRIKFRNINSNFRYTIYFLRVLLSRIFNFSKNIIMYKINRFSK